MPTNRTRRTRAPAPDVSANVRRFLAIGESDPGDFEVFALQTSEARVREVWELVREEIMATWAKAHPYSRPAAWWDFDAPRWTRTFGAYFDGTLPEPRRRLGGIGTEDFECLAIVPSFDHGLPTGFVTKWQERYYNGKAKDIDGNPIGTEFKVGDFKGKAIDPADPPRYESEAQYLLRLNLLTEAEKRHLARHPELLRPTVGVIEAADEAPADPATTVLSNGATMERDTDQHP